MCTIFPLFTTNECRIWDVNYPFCAIKTFLKTQQHGSSFLFAKLKTMFQTIQITLSYLT